MTFFTWISPVERECGGTNGTTSPPPPKKKPWTLRSHPLLNQAHRVGSIFPEGKVEKKNGTELVSIGAFQKDGELYLL